MSGVPVGGGGGGGGCVDKTAEVVFVYHMTCMLPSASGLREQRDVLMCSC